ncbi:MAG: hypothetical protein AB7O78_07295 [Thermoleophilia bacterium]
MLTAVLVLLVGAAPASAHGGRPRPEFSSEIRALTPSVPGLEVRTRDGGNRLELRDTGHHTVVVLGYQGEPFARLLPDGSAQVNANSPATYLNRSGSASVVLPPQADPDAPPAWIPLEDDGRLQWHDHRAHWMGTGTPPQVRRESQRTKILDYRIPIVVDGRGGAIAGTLYWAGRPGRLPLIPAMAAVLGPVGVGMLVVWMLVRRMRRTTPHGPESPQHG